MLIQFSFCNLQKHKNAALCFCKLQKENWMSISYKTFVHTSPVYRYVDLMYNQQLRTFRLWQWAGQWGAGGGDGAQRRAHGSGQSAGHRPGASAAYPAQLVAQGVRVGDPGWRVDGPNGLLARDREVALGVWVPALRYN